MSLIYYRVLQGFIPNWIGEFYAYYQWFYGIPSVKVVERVPVEFLKKAYFGLHDLELELAVNKVGGIQWIPPIFSLIWFNTD